MTEYQRIENKLRSLGWVPEKSKGDHFKFKKDGEKKFILVSMNVGTSPRSLENTLADIRRKEPRFQLGRPAGSVPAAEEPAEPEVSYDGLPEWLRPGENVRWTAPEDRDYGLLEIEESLMSQMYVVVRIDTEKEPAKVTIQDAGKEHSEFDVPVDELDAWQLLSCSECGKKLPLNRMARKDDGTPVCADCVEKIRKEAEQKQKDDERGKALSKDLEVLKRTNEQIKAIEEKYRNVRFGDLPEGDKTAMYQEYKKVLDKLPGRLREKMLQDCPEIGVLFKDKPRVNTPFESWRAFLSAMLRNASMMTERLQDGKAFEKFKNELYACTYSTKRLLKNKEAGTAIPVIDITAKTPQLEYLMWSFQDSLFQDFRHLYPDDAAWCLTIGRVGDGRQFLANHLCRNDREEIPLLSGLVSKAGWDGGFERTTQDAALPCLCDAKAEVVKWMRDILVMPEEDDIALNSPFEVFAVRNVRPKDIAHFHDAPSFYSVYIKYDDVNYPIEKYNKLVEEMKKGGAPLSFPAEIFLRTISVDGPAVCMMGCLGKDFGKEYDEREVDIPEREDYGCAPGETLLRIVRGEGENKFMFGHPDRDDAPFGRLLEKAFVTTLMEEDSVVATAMLYAMNDVLNAKEKPAKVKEFCDVAGLVAYGLEEGRTMFSITSRGDKGFSVNAPEFADDKERDAFVDAVEGTLFTLLHGDHSDAPLPTALRRLVDDEIRMAHDTNNTTDNDMETDILNLNNPGAENEALRDVTTRELLRELKARGVEFPAVQITVKKNIDMAEI